MKDLRAFLELLERRGELLRVTAEVSPELEISEICDRVVKRGGPALLFERVTGGHGIPVLINAFGSYRRMAWALGVERWDQLGQKVERLLALARSGPPAGLAGLARALGDVAPLMRARPRLIDRARCQEVVVRRDEAGFSVCRFPILKCWPQDGGRYITLPLVFTHDPNTGQRNVGMYRLQVFDDRTLGMHWHLHKGGAEHFHHSRQQRQRLEVAAALGADPASIYAATAPLPPGVDELLFAGFLRGQPVPMVRCKTVNLTVPADSEIVLEGYVDPAERRLEGPFGDHTGYYSLADEYPVLHLTCITHRRDPIYPTIIVGRPPMEDDYLGKATERLFLPLIKMIVPEVVDINMPIEGVFHNLVLVSIRKRYPGQARKVMYALWGMGQMMLAKTIIVVDHDVDVQNPGEMVWRVTNNIDPRRDVFFVDGPLDALDHAAVLPHYGSKMGVDATRKASADGFMRPWPDDIVMSDDVKDLVTGRWRTYFPDVERDPLRQQPGVPSDGRAGGTTALEGTAAPRRKLWRKAVGLLS
jgi:4-hydroxy-3-polyprenylbenzoate decarboxylase